MRAPGGTQQRLGCPTPTKFAFPSRAAARRALKRWNGVNGFEAKAYHCKDGCQLWHITTHPRQGREAA